MSIAYRTAGPADAPALAATGRRCFAETFGGAFPPDDMALHLETRFGPDALPAEYLDPVLSIRLAEDGASVRVIDVHTIKPFDVEAICRAARECGVVVTLEEHVVNGGLGGAVAEACLENAVQVTSFRRLGIDDRYPSIVGDQDYMRAHFGLDCDAVAAVLREMLDR